MKTKHLIAGVLILLFWVALALILFKPGILGNAFRTTPPHKAEDCSGRPYYTDAMNLRASGRGQSVDAQTAQRMATLNARSTLVLQQAELTEDVITEYLLGMKYTDEEMRQRYNKIIMHFGSSMSRVRTICQHEEQLESESFIIKVVIEIAGSDLLEMIERQIRLDEILAEQYNPDLLERIFYRTLKAYGGK